MLNSIIEEWGKATEPEAKFFDTDSIDHLISEIVFYGLSGDSGGPPKKGFHIREVYSDSHSFKIVMVLTCGDYVAIYHTPFSDMTGAKESAKSVIIDSFVIDLISAGLSADCAKTMREKLLSCDIE